MKRLLSLFLLLLLLITLFAYSDASKAQNNSNSDRYEIERIKSGDYEYAVLDATKKTATLLKIGTEKKEVKIPKTIDGYTIVQIGICWSDYDRYFEDRYNFTEDEFIDFKISRHVFLTGGSTVEKIIFPESVVNIGDLAFEDMPNLKNLVLPKSLKIIFSNNFLNSTKLHTVTFEGSVHVLKSFPNKINRIVLKGNFNGESAEDSAGLLSPNGMQGCVENFDVKGKNRVEISTGGKIVKMTVFDSVKKLVLYDCMPIKNIFVKNKKTKIVINEKNIDSVQFDLGKYKKKKSGKYSWSRPKLEIYCNDDGSVKKSVKYLLKYKLKGKTKTKTVKKNKISKLKSDSKIHVYAVVKLKIKD